LNAKKSAFVRDYSGTGASTVFLKKGKRKRKRKKKCS